MEGEEFEFIEAKIEELEKRYNDYMEADKNSLAKKTYNTLDIYRKILDLMIDGQMYKDLKEQKKRKRGKIMEPILFILFITYFVITIIEINQDERRFEKKYGKRSNKANTIKTKIQYK